RLGVGARQGGASRGSRIDQQRHRRRVQPVDRRAIRPLSPTSHVLDEVPCRRRIRGGRRPHRRHRFTAVGAGLVPNYWVIGVLIALLGCIVGAVIALSWGTPFRIVKFEKRRAWIYGFAES